jgi:hypothetical protein
LKPLPQDDLSRAPLQGNATDAPTLVLKRSKPPETQSDRMPATTDHFLRSSTLSAKSALALRVSRYATGPNPAIEPRFSPVSRRYAAPTVAVQPWTSRPEVDAFTRVRRKIVSELVAGIVCDDGGS